MRERRDRGGTKESSRPVESFLRERISESSENTERWNEQAGGMLTEHVMSLSGTQFRDIKV